LFPFFCFSHFPSLVAGGLSFLFLRLFVIISCSGYSNYFFWL
jgi:hypothetical protein